MRREPRPEQDEQISDVSVERAGGAALRQLRGCDVACNEYSERRCPAEFVTCVAMCLSARRDRQLFLERRLDAAFFLGPSWASRYDSTT